jgi:hypothetical protein
LVVEKSWHELQPTEGSPAKPNSRQRRLENVSPPFEGGVAGTVDYLIFTMFIPRPGVVDLFLSLYHYINEKQNHLQ